jgi:hypothetical protein
MHENDRVSLCGISCLDIPLNSSISVPIYYAQLPLIVLCSSSSGRVDSRVIGIDPRECCPFTKKERKEHHFTLRNQAAAYSCNYVRTAHNNAAAL